MQELNKELFAIFKEFFEDEGIKKVWHNYSFDRHVLHNHGIDCRGFAADTMHMARLWDSSRQGKGYSLESLTGCVPCPPHCSQHVICAPPQACHCDIQFSEPLPPGEKAHLSLSLNCRLLCGTVVLSLPKSGELCDRAVCSSTLFDGSVKCVVTEWGFRDVCSDKKLMADYAADLRSKTGMKSLFGRKNIKKDNTEGKVCTPTTNTINGVQH